VHRDDLVGKLGRVTADIPGYNAYHVERDLPLARGTRVSVVEHYPPRTVVVTAF